MISFSEANMHMVIMPGSYVPGIFDDVRESFQSVRADWRNKRVVSYDIRHLFCTLLLSRGGDLASVSQLMGHASVKMTVDQYDHALPGEKRRAVELLPEL